MNILLLGADGFIGRHLAARLTAAGHDVVRGVRVPSQAGDMTIDLRADLTPEIWRPRLAGVDAVINAVGILNERQKGDFERIHHRAPAALFAACGEAGIARVVQISALGAARADTPYLASKAAADHALLAACPGGVVLRPALVFGAGGASSRFFLALASLPVLPLPGRGDQPLAPIHIDDLCALVLAALEAPPKARVIAATGPQTLTYRQLLAAYRRGLGFPPAWTFPVPAPWMRLAARLGDAFPALLLNRATWKMLSAGNTASAEEAAAAQKLADGGLLPPALAPSQFIPPQSAPGLRHQALAAWRRPLLRAVLAFLWWWTALVCLAWPQTGLELLAPFGLEGAAAWMVMLAAIGLDALFGLLTLIRPGRRLWLAQGGLIVAYSLLVAARLPEFFTHPFAPMAKNAAVLALLFLLWAEEEKP